MYDSYDGIASKTNNAETRRRGVPTTANYDHL